VTVVPQLPPEGLETGATRRSRSPGEISDGGPAVKPVPGHHQERFRCPNPKCGRSFQRNVRVGIWAACPTCGTRAYGMAVLQDMAAAGAARAVAPRPKRERKAPEPAPANGHQAAVIGVFSSEARVRARKTPVPAGPAMPAPAPAAVPPPRRGFLSSLLGSDGEM
jgi:ribosomal protein L37AE/L43A